MSCSGFCPDSLPKAVCLWASLQGSAHGPPEGGPLQLRLHWDLKWSPRGRGNAQERTGGSKTHVGQLERRNWVETEETSNTEQGSMLTAQPPSARRGDLTFIAEGKGRNSTCSYMGLLETCRTMHA